MTGSKFMNNSRTACSNAAQSRRLINPRTPDLTIAHKRFPADFLSQLSREEGDPFRCRVEAEVHTVGAALACIRSFLLRARVGLAVVFASRLPHRSGLADFPHPARQDTASLRERSAECTTTGGVSGKTAASALKRSHAIR